MSFKGEAHQRRVILALAEAFVPSLPDLAAQSREQGKLGLADLFDFPGPKGHDEAIATEAIQLSKRHLPAEKWKAVTLILWLLSTRLGTLLLGGRHAISMQFPFCRSFDEMTPSSREAMLLSWKRSKYLKPVLKALQGLVLFVMFSYHTPDGKNPLWPFIGYPGADPKKPEKPVKAKQESEAILMKGLVKVSKMEMTPAGLRTGLGQHLQVGESSEGVCSLECDAVVVGSGAGGGTAAGVLAKAGLKVLVIEKGTYTPAAELTTLEKDAYDNLYEMGGLLMTSEDGGVNIMAGATVGGGTRINWSVSFRTPPHVRKEWALVNGLPHFTSERYDRAMDAVCSRLGVKTGVTHNAANANLWKGLESLAADVEEMPRNCSNSLGCGHCPHGCAAGQKQDTTATFLADAAGSGAKILTGCFAKSIVTAPSQGSRGKRASGVILHPAGHPDLQIHIKAGIVVASAGSLHNPALLLRSGITCQGNVGKNLHLHCGAAFAARFPKKPKSEDPREGRINLWEGAQMSTYSREAAKWDNSGYGPLVSMTSAHPGLLAAGFSWSGAEDFKRKFVELPWLAGCCTYVRDREGGKVVLGPDGLPRVHYWPSKHDQASILSGIELGARAMVAAGAEALFSSMPPPNQEFSVQRDKAGRVTNAAELEAWIQGIHNHGVVRGDLAIFSLHQMGSCRMGSSVKDSVADGEGECWECADLFVADASAFPTASGVNPMITAESIAWMVADGIATRFWDVKKSSSD